MPHRQFEWNAFVAAIRGHKPHNAGKRAVYSDLANLMGRSACHTGQEVTWDQVMESRFEFCENPESFDYDTPAPVLPDENGQFPPHRPRE